jgi:Domain of unknown function (DUF4281)
MMTPHRARALSAFRIFVSVAVCASWAMAWAQTTMEVAPEAGPSFPWLDAPMLDVIFRWASTLVMPFWLLMILAPRWRVTARVMERPWGPALPAVVYAILVAPRLSTLLPVVADPTLPVISALLGSPQGALIAWLHFLAFDLFVGRHIWMRLRGTLLPSAWISLLLIATLLVGPLGYLFFLATLAFVQARKGTDANPTV